MEHIGKALSTRWPIHAAAPSVESIRNSVSQVREWELTNEEVARHLLLLTEYVRQEQICANCQGYEKCGKEGDMKGFAHTLDATSDGLHLRVHRCEPFHLAQLHRHMQKWAAYSGTVAEDAAYTFDNFPAQLRERYPRLMAWATTFADQYDGRERGRGLYLFGPPGVGKTHLLLAIVNRLQERDIPCLFARSDSLFDRLRHAVAAGQDLEPLIELYAIAPILAIDEFGQERPSEFTMEKLFRIINQRFHAGRPTLFTSNFAPPDVYRRDGADMQETAAPLRSRILQMALLARMDGADARLRHLTSLT